MSGIGQGKKDVGRWNKTRELFLEEIKREENCRQFLIKELEAICESVFLFCGKK